MNAIRESLSSSTIVSTFAQYTWTELTVGTVATYLTFLALRVIYSLNFHPLASYPGPWLARSGLPVSWSFLVAIKGRNIWALEDVHKRYGTWVRIGYNELSTLDEKAVPVVYSTSSKWTKTNYYEGFRPPIGPQNVFSATSVHEHSYLRRIASSCFAMSALLTMEPRFQRQALSLCNALEEKHAQTGKPADMAWYMLALAADTVGSLSFGHQDGFSLVASGANRSEMLEGTALSNDLSHMLGVHRNWGVRLWNFLANFVTAPPALKGVMKFGEKSVSDRRQRSVDPASAPTLASRLEKEIIEDAEERDMISWWLKTKDPLTGETLTNNKIVDNAMLMLFAGSDTTATTLRALLMYVTTTPRVKKKLRAEIDEAYERGACSWPAKYNETIHLEYFQACLKEALRMWPAVGWVLARQPPRGGSTIGQRHIPEGVSVGIPAPQYHRSAEHAFGPAPDEFRPERWIGGTDEQRRMRDANLLSFGAGTRICLGKNISLLEISIVFPMLMRKFDFQVIPRGPADGPADRIGKGSEHHNWKVFATWFALQSDMKMQLSLRQHDFEVESGSGEEVL